MRVCIGIPFRASPYVSALYLSLASIREYADSNWEIALLLDVTDGRTFDEARLRSTFPELQIKVKTWERDDLHAHHFRQKQRLVQWLTLEDKQHDAVILIHSDVYFLNRNALQSLIAPLKEDSEIIASYFEVPFTYHQSTFHKDEESRFELALAPRFSSWFMALNVDAYLKFREQRSLPFDLFEVRRFSWGDESILPINRWIDRHMRSAGFERQIREFQMDASSFLRFEMEEASAKGFSLGTETNPCLKTLEFVPRPLGFVHIEQFNPDRFDGTTYAPSLFERRAAAVSQLLLDKYGIEA